MSKSAVLLRNIASNWLGFAINAAVTLFLTPFVLRELGVGRYGIWILTSSVIGYYGFLDLGFRAGVTQYLTRYFALEDYESASDCISTAVAVLSILGALFATLSLGAAFIVPYLFHLPVELNHEAFWCILIVGLSGAIECVFAPFGAVFTARQRFDLSNLIGIVTRLLTAGGIVAALKTGQGLIGVSIAVCGANLVDYLTRWRVAKRLALKLNVSLRRANLAKLREIASFGAWNFLISVNNYVYQYVPNIMIGVFMPVAAVGHYALATGLSQRVNSVLGPVPQVVYPAATELHTRDNIRGLENLYHKASRLMMLVMIPVVLLAAFWADDFYRLWIGKKYLTGTPFHSVAALFKLLLISTFTGFSSSVAQQIITGTGKVRLVSKLLITGSIINLTCSLVLIRFFGLAGVAAGTVIASVVIDLLAMPLALQKILGFSVIAFMKKSCARPIIAGGVQAIIMRSIQMSGPAANFLELLFQGVVAVSGAGVVLAIIGLTMEERIRFLVDPLRNVVKRRKSITIIE